jgi:hypothetical protein
MVRVHFQSELEKQRAKPKGNESKDDSPDPPKPDC